MNAAYFRVWRAAHPEYRKRQNELRQKRRAITGRGDRRHEALTRLSRALAGVPPMHIGHPIFDQAREIVGLRRTSLISVYDPLYDDLLSEATLALVEGRDPEAAVRAYRTQEQHWGRITAPLIAEGIAS